jgi:hypothetical protein
MEKKTQSLEKKKREKVKVLNKKRKGTRKRIDLVSK